MKIKGKHLIVALLIAGILTAVVGYFRFDGVENAVADRLYQVPQATDGEIVIVGIDAAALERFGPMPWPRSVMAEVIDVLNNADPLCRPAVIGVDVLYAGESDPEEDAALAEAAASGGNVVMASAATFGSQLVETDEDFYMKSDTVLAFDRPYEALSDVTETGHINAMKDEDGYIRHALYAVERPDGGTEKAFSRVIYERYAAEKGLPLTEEPALTDGFFYIPFTAGKDGYDDGISIADVYDGLVDPAIYGGKIVLIAPYAAGLLDEYPTSVSRAAAMYGIEIQANLIDAYRAGFYPRKAPRMLGLALLFLVSFFMCLWFWKKKIGASAALWLSVSVLWVLLCKGLYKMGTVLPVVWIPAACTALFIAAVGVQYFKAQKEKRRVTATFGRYVDPAILKELLTTGGAAEDLGGKSRDIAVLFVDIRGFTTMSESLPPTTVVEILNRYLSLTTECVMRYHGTLDKFVGDCTMAFWNAPLAQEDYVYLACCAARDMVEGSAKLGEELEKEFGRTVSFGVGVHTGTAVIGNIGASRRMDYTAIGDTVNTAARLEANAPAGKILISRAVAEALGDRAEVTSLGDSIRLKGKAEGFEILTLDTLR